MRTIIRNVAVLAGVMGVVTSAAVGNSGLPPIIAVSEADRARRTLGKPHTLQTSWEET